MQFFRGRIRLECGSQERCVRHITASRSVVTRIYEDGGSRFNNCRPSRLSPSARGRRSAKAAEAPFTVTSAARASALPLCGRSHRAQSRRLAFSNPNFGKLSVQRPQAHNGRVLYATFFKEMAVRRLF